MSSDKEQLTRGKMMVVEVEVEEEEKEEVEVEEGIAAVMSVSKIE